MDEEEGAEIAEAIRMGYIELLYDGHFHCSYCNCPMSGEIQALAHIRGSKHLKKLRQAEQNEGQQSQNKRIRSNYQPEDPRDALPPLDDEYFCEVCNLQLNAKFQFDEHMKGKTHAKKLKNSNSASTEDVKNGSKTKNRGQASKEQKFWFEPGFF